ncbi:hypothetical protein EJB05_14629, partial [Eragrostis curvula]
MELLERMCKVAFWCVQQQPTARPSMGDVVKLLEREMDIDPPANPFQQVLASPMVVAKGGKWREHDDGGSFKW